MKLLEPTKIGDWSLANRMAMAPMTRSRANKEGVVGEMTVTYYEQRATAGLIITEAINISEQAIGSPGTPGLYTKDQQEAWQRVTKGVHAKGGRIIAQLWHTGRVGHSSIRKGELPVSSSAVRIEGQQHFTGQSMVDFEVPRALTTDEVKAVVQDYRRAAQMAKDASFEGVELHSAFGYLPNQFLVDGVNQRTDEYGGSLENRTRFVVEIMHELVEIWGPHKVGIKLSPTVFYNGITDSDPIATFSHLIHQLNELPLAYIQMMQFPFPAETFPNWPKDTVLTFGPMIKAPVMANGGYTYESAEDLLEAGRASLVSFGALFLANPDLPERFQIGATLNPPDKSTFYGGQEGGYIDYPFLDQVTAFKN